MNRNFVISIALVLSLVSCIPGTRSAKTYQDRMTGGTIIESGDTRLSTDSGSNIYVGYIAHISQDGNLENITMEVTYNNSDWLFYESCWIKIDDKAIIKKTGLHTNREIIGRYNLMERGRFRISKETLLAIANSKHGLIRTIGSKGYVEGEINQSLRTKSMEFARKISLLN